MKALVDLVAGRHGPEAAVGVGLSLLNLEAAFPGCGPAVEAQLGEVEAYRERQPGGPPAGPLDLPSAGYRAAVRSRGLAAADQLAILRGYFELRAESPGLGLADFVGIVLAPPAPPAPPPAEDAAPAVEPGEPVVTEKHYALTIPERSFWEIWGKAEAMVAAGEYGAVDLDAYWRIHLAPRRVFILGVAAAEGGPYLDAWLSDPEEDGRVVADSPPAYRPEGVHRLVDGDVAYVVDVRLEK